MEPEVLWRVVCDESEIKSTLASGGVVGKLPSVGADSDATGAVLLFADATTAVA
jgi:hypothetical protein